MKKKKDDEKKRMRKKQKKKQQKVSICFTSKLCSCDGIGRK